MHAATRRPVSEEEQISVHSVPVPPAPDWLRSIQLDAKERDVDCLTHEEINSEIAAARRERRNREHRLGQ